MELIIVVGYKFLLLEYHWQVQLKDRQYLHLACALKQLWSQRRA